MIEQTFTQDDIDTRDPAALEEAGWFRAVKTTPTLMRFVSGGFRCLTREGYIDIDDTDHGGAYLAIDAEGYPYPIAATVYDATYKRLELADAADTPDVVLLGSPPPSSVYVSLAEIVDAKANGVLSQAEAHDAAKSMLVKSGILDAAAETPAE